MKTSPLPHLLTPPSPSSPLLLLLLLLLLFHLHCAHFPGSNFVSLPLFLGGAQMEIIMAAEEGKKEKKETFFLVKN